jgi:hypothetical protein
MSVKAVETEWTPLRSEILEYEKGDYLLLDRIGIVLAVGGNSEVASTDFGRSPPDGPYVVIKVVEIRKE